MEAFLYPAKKLQKLANHYENSKAEAMHETHGVVC